MDSIVNAGVVMCEAIFTLQINPPDILYIPNDLGHEVACDLGHVCLESLFGTVSTQTNQPVSRAGSLDTRIYSNLLCSPVGVLASDL